AARRTTRVRFGSGVSIQASTTSPPSRAILISADVVAPRAAGRERGLAVPADQERARSAAAVAAAREAAAAGVVAPMATRSRRSLPLLPRYLPSWALPSPMHQAETTNRSLTRRPFILVSPPSTRHGQSSSA